MMQQEAFDPLGDDGAQGMRWAELDDIVIEKGGDHDCIERAVSEDGEHHCSLRAGLHFVRSHGALLAWDASLNTWRLDPPPAPIVPDAYENYASADAWWQACRTEMLYPWKDLLIECLGVLSERLGRA